MFGNANGRRTRCGSHHKELSRQRSSYLSLFAVLAPKSDKINWISGVTRSVVGQLKAAFQLSEGTHQ